ncbi:hypothetical protein [Streptomyces griseorubiginosus]|uniref:hypothetical protein n=1 Tax=Streptomyces griseorubiginosus TaxID=67304 RepID=UPI00131A8635|nr:hypothetical protein [Streptomyces griseorubiginosus]
MSGALRERRAGWFGGRRADGLWSPGLVAWWSPAGRLSRVLARTVSAAVHNGPRQILFTLQQE